MSTEKFKTYGEAQAYIKGLGNGYLADEPQLNCDNDGRWTYDVTATYLIPVAEMTEDLEKKTDRIDCERESL